MSTFVLSARQKRLLAAVEAYRERPNARMRDIEKEFSISHGSLCQAVKDRITIQSLLAAVDGRGRRPRLNKEEEKLIANAALEFQSNGTPLSKLGIRQLAQTFVETLPESRRKVLGFKNNLPGEDWLNGFLKRNTNLSVKRRAALEYTRAEAMNPETVAIHFARISALCDKHSIKDGRFVFNLDECGLCIRGMASRGREKCIVQRNTRGNTRELQFRGSTDHVTFMPVVSATGQVYTPVVVLPGVQARYRKRGREYETPTDFLPSPSYVYMREKAGVDSEIFTSWARKFVEETKHVRRGGQKLLVVLDNFGGHVQFDALSTLKNNGIIVAGLPAHTSHVLQPLDVGVFGPFKEAFKNLLNTRAITTEKTARSDIFTICELLSIAFGRTVISCNIVAGFRRSGLWVQQKKGCEPDAIRALDFTSSAMSASVISNSLHTRRTAVSITADSEDVTVGRFTCYKQLYNLYLRKAEQLCSDGTVEESGTIQICARTGGTLTSDNVIHALKLREEKKKAEAEQRVVAQAEREKRKEAKEAAAEEKKAARIARQQKAEEAEEAYLITLREKRLQTRASLSASRKLRRERARIRSGTIDAV